ncbi:MAG: hypothetical protein JW871_05310 [Endomicrobiales bacterium]|nr:hypothetical protein [Endomicrobiales bacterium]
MKKFSILMFVFALLICFDLQSGADSEGELPDVIIKGKEVLELESTKPPLNIPIDQDKELMDSLVTETEIFTKKPTGWEKQTYDSLPETVKSPQVIIPRSHHIYSETVKVFSPLSDLESIFKEPNKKEAKKLARWEFVIADDSGNTFQEYSGSGLPPESIVFNGRNSSGDIIEVGYSYSTILRYYDTKNQLHTTVENPFVIMGFAHQKDNGYTISLNLKNLYDERPEVLKEQEFSNLGQELLQEASDIIKKKYFAFPVKVVVNSKEQEIAQITSKEIASKLKKMLIRTDETVQEEGKITPKSIETVDIILLNR